MVLWCLVSLVFMFIGSMVVHVVVLGWCVLFIRLSIQFTMEQENGNSYLNVLISRTERVGSRHSYTISQHSPDNTWTCFENLYLENLNTECWVFFACLTWFGFQYLMFHVTGKINVVFKKIIQIFIVSWIKCRFKRFLKLRHFYILFIPRLCWVVLFKRVSI